MRILFYCEGNDDISCLHIKTLRGNMSVMGWTADHYFAQL
jgi:hypothetical protein